MTLALLFAAVSSCVAVCGLVIHIIAYSYREGRKEQRLTAVEEKVKTISGVEVILATVNANMGALKEQLAEFKADVTRDISEVSETVRSLGTSRRRRATDTDHD